MLNEKVNLVNDTPVNLIGKSTDYRVAALTSSIICIYMTNFHYYNITVNLRSYIVSDSKK